MSSYIFSEKKGILLQKECYYDHCLWERISHKHKIFGKRNENAIKTRAPLHTIT